MKNFVVPLDLTKSAEPELSSAIEIVRTCKATLFMVEFLPAASAGFKEENSTVFENGYAGQVMLNVETLKRHTERLNQLATIFRAEGIPVMAEVVNASFSHGLKGYVERHRIDLVIMQSSGQHNLLQRLKGNRLERAIEGNNCPVLSLQDHINIYDLRKLTVAIDLDSDYKPENMSIIKYLADCFQSEITLLHIKSENVDPVTLNNKVLHFKKKFGFEGCAVHFIESQDIEDTIIRYAENNDTGLIVLVTKAPGGILRLFTNSVSENVANSAQIPVLTIND